MLKQISYFRNLSNIELDILLYRLDRKNYAQGTEIFNEENFADRIIFIAKGKTILQFSVRDRRAYRIVNENPQQKEFSENWSKVRKVKNAILALSNSSRSSNNMSNIVALGQAKFYLNLCALGPGSVLCAKQAIVEADIRTRLIATESCEILSLSLSDIEYIANRSKRLKRGIDTLREKYIRWDNEVQNYIVVTPILDYKLRTSNKNQYKEVRKARLARTFMNAILTIISRKRLQKASGILSIKSLVKKLRAIVLAEELEWGDLARKIAQGEVLPGALKMRNYISSNEMSRSVLTQFARQAQRAGNIINEVDQKFNEMFNAMKLGHSSHRNVRKSFEEIKGLISRVERRFGV